MNVIYIERERERERERRSTSPNAFALFLLPATPLRLAVHIRTAEFGGTARWRRGATIPFLRLLVLQVTLAYPVHQITFLFVFLQWK
jgi:hypothetical protein